MNQWIRLLFFTDTQDGMDLEDDMDDIVDTLSEPADEEISDVSDLDIDLEAVEEINELIENTKKDFDSFEV